MAGGDEQGSGRTNIANFPLRGALPMTQTRTLDEAHASVAAAMQWAQAAHDDLCINMPAVRHALRLALHWLDTSEPMADRLDSIYEEMANVARVHASFEWLFDGEDEPKIEAITPEIFERLVELRVVADRILRMIST